MKKILFVLGVSLFILNVYAVETDQFITWDIELSDSQMALNKYLNTNLKKAVSKFNRKNNPKHRCEDVATEFFWQVKGRGKISKISIWANTTTEVEKYPDPLIISDSDYEKMSIHSGMKFRNHFVKLARTINVAGIYMGTDKLGHMFLVGKEYYTSFLKDLKKGLSQKTAIENSIKEGLKIERYYLGYYISGVLSFADIEANYQGFRLGLDMCEGDNSIIKKKEGIFVIDKDIDIKKYVNPNFDESYNFSFYNPHKFKQVRPVLKEICFRRGNEIYKERLKFYRSFENSENINFVNDLTGRDLFYTKRFEQTLPMICRN